jgi:anti-sigma B factor antagonist
LSIQAFGPHDRRTRGLNGELDLGSVSTFEDTLVEACGDGARKLVLELSRLEFIDATGLEAVLSAKTLCARRGCAVVLNPLQDPDQRASELVRLVDHLPFRRSSRAKPADARREDAPGGARLISAWD